MLATLLAVLYVLAPLAIALWPLPETSWLGRVFVQGLFAVIVWPLVWCLCFAVFAVTGKAALSLGAGHGLTQLIEPFIAVAALYVAFKLPRIIAAQATTVGVLPNVGHTAYTLSSVRNVIGSRGGSARAAGPSSGAVGGGAGRGAAAAGEVADG